MSIRTDKKSAGQSGEADPAGWRGKHLHQHHRSGAALWLRQKGLKRLLKAVEDLLIEIEVLPFEVPADAEYGGIISELERAGRLIGGNDLLVAAHACAIGATIVTANTDEFRRGSWPEGGELVVLGSSWRHPRRPPAEKEHADTGFSTGNAQVLGGPRHALHFVPDTMGYTFRAFCRVREMPAHTGAGRFSVQPGPTVTLASRRDLGLPGIRVAWRRIVGRTAISCLPRVMRIYYGY